MQDEFYALRNETYQESEPCASNLSVFDLITRYGIKREVLERIIEATKTQEDDPTKIYTPERLDALYSGDREKASEAFLKK